MQDTRLELARFEKGVKAFSEEYDCSERRLVDVVGECDGREGIVGRLESW